MKKLIYFLWLVFFGFWMLGAAHATLYDRGGGLIYDDVLNITWLQDANYAMTSGYDSDGRMFWNEAVEWAEQLNYQGYSDWRLPATPDGPWSYSEYYGPDSGDSYATYVYSYTIGYNLYNSEMGYMFYKNLGNLGIYDVDGTTPPGWGLTNVSFNSGGPGGPIVSFSNIMEYYYWSGTECIEYPYPGYAWWFHFNEGGTAAFHKTTYLHRAWAVRDGDSSPVPIPGAVWLLGSGLVGLLGLRGKYRK